MNVFLQALTLACLRRCARYLSLLWYVRVPVSMYVLSVIFVRLGAHRIPFA